MTVATATSAVEALGVCVEGEVTLVLCDLHLALSFRPRGVLLAVVRVWTVAAGDAVRGCPAVVQSGVHGASRDRNPPVPAAGLGGDAVLFALRGLRRRAVGVAV